jgi:hypothetical protein
MTWYQKRFTKYGNRTTIYNGIQYHSMFEADYASTLDLMVKAGELDSWERQVKIDLRGENGTHITNYFIDFVLTHKDGLTEYVECKGFMTDVFNLKWKMFEDKMKNEKNIKITMVKR